MEWRNSARTTLSRLGRASIFRAVGVTSLFLLMLNVLALMRLRRDAIEFLTTELSNGTEETTATVLRGATAGAASTPARAVSEDTVPAGAPAHSQLLPVPEGTLLKGQRRASTGFLTIGIASVYRKENYLQRTLKSLREKSTPDERSNITVVLLLADTNATVRDERLQRVSDQFADLFQEGFLQVIRAPEHLYPDLNFTSRRRTYNDPAPRVRWRVKQVMDFAFLFSYCYPLSEFYMVLEDDIITSNRYLTAVRDFIHIHRKHDWVGLKFSQFLIIGNLIRSSSLPKLVQLTQLFREEQPIDFIMLRFLDMMVPGRGPPTRRVPSLFNHIGRSSTLPKKTQKLVDREFKTLMRKFSVQNPPAQLVTNMAVHKDYLPEYAYSAAPGCFWAKKVQKTVGTLDVVLEQKQRLTRAVVISGYSTENVRVAKDRVTHGKVLVASELISVQEKSADCSDWTELGIFDELGVVDSGALAQLMPYGVQCLRVEVDAKVSGLVAISEIALFLA